MQKTRPFKAIKIAALICAIVGSNGSYAQWTTSGGNTTTTDNVGIGVATPDAKLSILSGYSNAGCVSYSGKPAVKIEWQVPDLACPFPGPTGPIPNILEIYNKYTLMGPPIISPYFWLDYAGRLGLGAYPSGNNRLTISGSSMLNGAVQIGNQPLPSGAKLVVDGDIAMANSSASASRTIKGFTATGTLNLATNTGSSDGPAIEMYGQSHASRAGRIHICSYGSSGTGVEFVTYDPSVSTWRSNMKIQNDGKVIIGNTQPTGAYAGYKLGVDGDIVCKRAVVQISNWADFVFKPDYKLPSLSEVEDYIQKNNHLPDVPSEKIILEEGVDMGAMNKILLQKVEELTLYMIQQQKEIELLKTSMQSAK
jgi:hypothetical protein